MTMQHVGPFVWPPQQKSSNPTTSSMVLDASDEIAALVLSVSKTGNIRRVHFRTRTVTTGATIDLRLETVNLTTGQNSGTLWATNTNIAVVIADANDNLWIRSDALTADAAVVVGDVLAVVIKNPTASPGNMQIAGIEPMINDASMPYILGPLSSNFTTLGGIATLIIVLEYDDETFVVPDWILPATSISTVVANTGTNPDEFGVYFTPSVKMRVCGWYASLALAASSSYKANLYAVGNDTPLLSSTYDSDLRGSGSQRWYAQRFAAQQVLSAGTSYRLGLSSLTASNCTGLYWEVPSAHPTILDGMTGLAGLQYTERNRSGTSDPDAAAWTEINYRRIFGGLIIDQLDDGAGGGGGVQRKPSNMRGGF